MKIRQINEDPFLKKIIRGNTEKLEVNNTPIRFRETNKENSLLQQNKNIRIDNYGLKDQAESKSNFVEQSISNSRTISRKRLNTIAKPCVNHAELEAEYKILIDNEVLNYCNKCAAHLASNGFQVEKLAPSKSPKRIKESNYYQSIVPPKSPYSRRKQQLSMFLNNLKRLEQNYHQKNEKLKKIVQSYEIQKQTVSNFYASMSQYLEYIRDEHLKFIEEESLRNSQICQIQSIEINETLEQIQETKQDIQTNVDKIIEEVGEQNYAECMSFYNQKYQMHEHRLQQIGNEARPSTLTPAQFVQEKLQDFKQFIDQLSGIRNSKMESSYDY